ncbi:MFS transporter [Chitinispirillales bacterium ANBcel5]|uniref:MFS transporter n=1 Tax=Cellulosispirillum alkaliphilum TaxID=3039283 RepID=UPI002A58A58A|nr:MFS transporter [Chitinispirillales bacterium ANBcel5]
MKRWFVLIAGVMCQTALGGIYAWSTFVPHFVNTYNLTNAQCGLIFGVMVATFTVATLPAGSLLVKVGPRITAGIGALLFAAGYVLSSFSGGNYLFLIASLGIVVGTGIGFAYVCPLTVGMKWFPENKGLVTGISVAGFGVGAILLSSIAERLLLTMDVLLVFRIIGLILGGLAFVSAMFMSEPSKQKNSGQGVQSKVSIRAYLFSSQFLLIIFAMFASTFAGLLISGNLKPMKLSLGLSDAHATLTISLFAIGNTIGRLVWGQIHDHLKSRNTVVISLLYLGVSVLPILWVRGPTGAFLTSALVGFGFGASFVVYASSVVEKFGVDLLPRLYPICFMAYGFAALIGPAVGGWMADLSGSYSYALISSAGIVFFALALIYIGFSKKGTGQTADEPLEAVTSEM